MKYNKIFKVGDTGQEMNNRNYNEGSKPVTLKDLMTEMEQIEAKMEEMATKSDIASLERRYSLLEVRMGAMVQINSRGTMESMPMKYVNRSGYRSHKKERVPGF